MNNLCRSILSKLRDTDWWASNQGTIAGIFIALGFLACVFYLAHLIFAVALSIFATLGMTHWYGWLGFGLFGFTFGVCVVGVDEDAEPRRRCVVIPLRPAPRERIKAMGGGNTRVTAEDRWGRAA